MSKTQSLGLEQARANLPAVVAHAHAGGISVITRHGKPYAAVVPVEVAIRARARGSLLGLRGSGKGLWGASASRGIASLRGEWD